ncbi:MAG: hypothetical protein JWO31_3026 [Phycisphaerales bacterium]|nr:hypothetical protein [Phycisphaerales bacterium]
MQYNGRLMSRPDPSVRVPPSLRRLAPSGSRTAVCLAVLALIAAHCPSPAVAAPTDDGAVLLTVVDRGAHDVELTRPEPGVTEVRTTGRDPYVLVEPAGGKPLDVVGPDAAAAVAGPGAATVLAFEYFSQTGTNSLEVFTNPTGPRPASVSGPGLSVAQGWTTHAVDLRPLLAGAKGPLRGLRIDLGTRPNRTVRLRSLTLRPRTDPERQADAARDAKRAADVALDARLATYLAAAPTPAAVTAVRVDAARVRIEGTLGDAGAAAAGVVLVEVPLWGDPTDLASAVARVPVAAGPDGRFAVAIDRLVPLDGRPHDRLLSRWAVARENPATGSSGPPASPLSPPSSSPRPSLALTALSSAHWADDVSAPADAPPAVTPRSMKGIGGFGAGRLESDLDDLDVGAVTVNVPITAVVRADGGAGRTPFDYAGRTWWSDDGAVAGFDQTMLAAARRGIVVSAIILIPPPRGAPAGSFPALVAHPDADPSGIFTMPNFTSRDGCEAYAAALEFLARRYSRPDEKYGRIHHYILHNEVDAGWVWTNAGEKSARTYLDLYHRSMRVAHLVARGHDPNAKAFISLTHHWADPGDPRWYGGRNLLDLLLAFGRAEGDFDWALAHHPYPQNLGKPRVWEDTQATYSLDTPKVTFKNLEVLDAWARQPRAMFRGERARTIHLTEQGLNSPDYSEASLRDQAAGLAFAWAKVERLKSIEAFQYHNWVDNRGEGGLRIGLRRFPDDPQDPLGPKPIWHLYKALGTPGEAAAMVPYLGVIRAKSWDEVMAGGPIR